MRSSSSACRRAVALSGWPESIRDSSMTRSLPDTAAASAMLRPSRSILLTAIWASAKAATWARWVTTMTW